MCAAQLRLADLFGSCLHVDKGGHNIERVEAALVTDELLLEDFLGALGFAGAVGEIGGGNRLQIVYVVQEDTVEAVDLRIDVARYCDIDDEHGAVATAVEKLLRV